MSNRDLQGFLQRPPNRNKSHFNVLNQTMQAGALAHENDLANTSLDVEEVGTMLLSRGAGAST